MTNNENGLSTKVVVRGGPAEQYKEPPQNIVQYAEYIEKTLRVKVSLHPPFDFIRFHSFTLPLIQITGEKSGRNKKESVVIPFQEIPSTDSILSPLEGD